MEFREQVIHLTSSTNQTPLKEKFTTKIDHDRVIGAYLKGSFTGSLHVEKLYFGLKINQNEVLPANFKAGMIGYGSSKQTAAINDYQYRNNKIFYFNEKARGSEIETTFYKDYFDIGSTPADLVLITTTSDKEFPLERRFIKSIELTPKGAGKGYYDFHFPQIPGIGNIEGIVFWYTSPKDEINLFFNQEEAFPNHFPAGMFGLGPGNADFFSNNVYTFANPVPNPDHISGRVTINNGSETAFMMNLICTAKHKKQ